MARVLVLIAGCAGVALAWLTVMPTAIGGPASYVVTDGTSMLPQFKADGLVVTRAQDSYDVGDVVAYHNRQLGVVVMHRIVGRDGSRYIFRGDNNNFRDLYHPTRADLVGKEWLYVPDGGRYMQWLRSPLAFALLLGLIGWIAGTALVPKKSSSEATHAR